ncbi:hypothetical protein FNV43_RR14727 [Rhamnella rubrinervis]|uniref:Uncharacterized protein n=1 Tax=Rhamnella rubrinervis TaxID=2594499 RepID=A0A8K0H3P8_9ROSA|nr:hypothetical protein FNV43_RR14727 [Rhamnella rubrinervis]
MLSFVTLVFAGHLSSLELAGASIATVGIQGLAYGIMEQPFCSRSFTDCYGPIGGHSRARIGVASLGKLLEEFDLILSSRHVVFRDMVQPRISTYIRAATQSYNLLGFPLCLFIALDNCGKEAEWLRYFLEDIPKWPKPMPVVSIHYDSQSAIRRAQNVMYNVIPVRDEVKLKLLMILIRRKNRKEYCGILLVKESSI